MAQEGDEIWVAEETYKSDEYIGGVTGQRTETFQLKKNVKIYGGFSPDDGLDIREERNWAGYPAVLDGDIKKIGKNSDNSYHVITIGSNIDETAMPDGFIIKGGNSKDGRFFNIGADRTGPKKADKSRETTKQTTKTRVPVTRARKRKEHRT